VDNTKARQLRHDGTYWIPPRPKGAKPRRAQTEFMARTQQSKATAPKSRGHGTLDKLLPKPRPELPT